MKFEGKNLIEFHEELLKVTKILSDMNIINIGNNTIFYLIIVKDNQSILNYINQTLKFK